MKKLSIKARLNVDADKIATENASIPKNTHISSATLIMYINNKYIHYKFDHSLRRLAHANDAAIFLRKKYKWNNNTFQNICWPQHSSSLNNMTETRKRHAIRFIHHRLPTGKMQFGLKHPCPHCKIVFDHNSDHDHFLTCIKSEDQKFKRIQKIELVMLQLNTPPNLRQQILHRISQYYQRTQEGKQQNKLPPSEDTVITQCLALQNDIGWNHFIRGRITSAFRPIVQQYYSSNKLGRTFKGTRWEKQMITSLLNIHIEEWIENCSITHLPSPGIKNSAPVHSTLIALIKQYYKLSTNLPRTKKKWFSRKLSQFEEWKVSDLQKWLRTAKRILHRQKINQKVNHQLNHPKVKKQAYIHHIVPPISRDILSKRKPTTMTKYFTNNIVQVSQNRNKSMSERSLKIQTDNTDKYTKHAIQISIANKIKRKENSIQEKKTMNKRLVQHTNRESVLTAYVTTHSPLTGNFNNKNKKTQSFLNSLGTKFQSKCPNEKDREYTQVPVPIQDVSKNRRKITANGQNTSCDTIDISKNIVSHPIKILDSTNAKQSSQQKILFIKNPYIQHSTKLNIPRIPEKSCLPQISSKNTRTNKNENDCITPSQFIQGMCNKSKKHSSKFKEANIITSSKSTQGKQKSTIKQSPVLDQAPSTVEGQYHICHKSLIKNDITISRSIKTPSNIETRNKGCALNVNIVTSGYDSVITNQPRSNFDKELERIHIREDMKNNVTKERLTEEIATNNNKRLYKPTQHKSNSMTNYGKMKATKLYIQHENECYELLSTNTSNNIENQQKYEAVQRQKSSFHKMASINNQSEKEDNDALDLCDKHDIDELKWNGGHSPTKCNNIWEELYTDTNPNAVTNKYGCRLQNSQRNVTHELQNKDDCDLNGSMWDNNKLHEKEMVNHNNVTDHTKG